jgi:hypothetical protein
MKKLIVLFLMAQSFNLFAQQDEASCGQKFVDKKTEKYAGDGCDITDKLTACSEVKPPNALEMKRKVDGMFSGTENIPWQSKYEKGTFKQLYTYGNADDPKTPVHLLNWFSPTGTKDKNSEILKTKIVEDFVDYSQKYNCVPLIKHHRFSGFYRDISATSRKELSEIMSAPDFKAQKAAFFKNINDKALTEKNICDENLEVVERKRLSDTFKPCAGNISGLYKDNEWNTSTLDKKISSSEASEVSACIKSSLALGAKIRSISIESSASALNNTGAAAEKFCKKGFLALSEARAENAKNNILPQLFTQAGSSVSKYQSAIVLNYQGTNKDGTSGPCPYNLTGNKEVIKDEFKSDTNKKALNQFKFVKIKVIFAAHEQDAKDKNTYYDLKYSCRSIDYDCPH